MSIGRIAKRDRLYGFKEVSKSVKKKASSKATNIVRNTDKKRLGKTLILIFAISIGSLAFYKVGENYTKNYYVEASSINEVDQLELKAPSIESNSGSVYGLNTSTYESSSSVIKKDKRAFVLDRWFEQYGSPLYGHGQTFVNACDEIGAPRDCIVVAAIAFNETHLCTYPGSAEMFNCWGFGGGGKYRATFSSFEESIYRVTDVLVNQYGLKYMEDPRLMEKTFCGVEDPLCAAWGTKILSIMRNLKQFGRNLGVEMGE